MQSPFSDDAGTVLAHYYNFAQISHEHKLIKTAEGKFKFRGDSLPFPKLLPMAEVPAGGYPESHDFNVQFTTMLNQLQAAWQDGNPDELENAIDIMTTGLADAARVLMVKPLPSGEGNFGPSFQLAS